MIGCMYLTTIRFKNHIAPNYYSKVLDLSTAIDTVSVAILFEARANK